MVRRRRQKRSADRRPAAPVVASALSLVAELVDRYSEPLPDDHVCTLPFSTPSGETPRHTCSHAVHETAALLDRVEALVEPGTTPGEGRSHAKGVPAGSPAPWDARAAELLDEVLRGAVDYAVTVRRLLEFSPLLVRVPVCDGVGVVLPVDRDGVPLGLAGRAALRDLAMPGRLELLADRKPGHWLVRGELIDPEHPKRGYRPGAVEASVRRWHTRSLEVAGFDAPRPRWLWWAQNPMTEWERADVPLGPACPAQDLQPRLRMQQVTCGHRTCLAIAYAGMGDTVPVWCPECWHRGLQVEPLTGLVFCPRCLTQEGNRMEWASVPWVLRAIEATVRAELGLSDVTRWIRESLSEAR